MTFSSQVCMRHVHVVVLTNPSLKGGALSSIKVSRLSLGRSITWPLAGSLPESLTWPLVESLDKGVNVSSEKQSGQ